ncbi:MAG TPA: ECF transporter S component [Anaerolineales bacterium]|nr:ECF transporter S component [Anaerolineales bacterium]
MRQRLTWGNLFFAALTLAGVAFFLFPFWAPGSASTAIGAGTEGRSSLLLFSAAVAMILLAILSEAQQGLTMHTIAMLGALVGLNTALRMIDNLLPLPGGFSPVFLLITLVGFVFGARLGFLMGALTLLVSDPVSPGGMGPWTPYQMLAAGWAGMTAAMLPRRSPIWVVALLGALWGWLYGALTNLYFWPYALGAPDLSWSPALGPIETLVRYARYYLVTSLAWDTMRAAGNFALLLLLGAALVRALERFRRRATVTWEAA